MIELAQTRTVNVEDDGVERTCTKVNYCKDWYSSVGYFIPENFFVSDRKE